MDTLTFLVVLTIFFGAFTQSLTGFGMGLVAMAVLPAWLGLEVATPLVALVGLALEATMLIRYRAALQVGAIGRLLVASLAAIPAGMLLLRQLDERLALFVLGVVIAGYAAYALSGFRLPELLHPWWAWGIGIVSGLLGGAYNTAGPPVVIYGDCRRWSPAEFKSNLSGFFLVNSVMVVSTHVWSGHVTPGVLTFLAWSVPALFAGFLAGQGLDRLINPAVFRRIVLGLLVVLGVRLMIG